MKKCISLLLALVMVLSFASIASADSAVKIGGIGPTTGPAAIYGNAVKYAMEIAVEEVNALGGLQFELRFEDDAHDAEQSCNAYNTLMDWGMQVLLGTVTTTPCAAVAAMSAEDNVFTLTPSASGPAVTQGRTNVFQMCFSDPNQGSASAEYIAKHFASGIKVAVIYNNGDAYSTGIYEKFASKAAELGISIVYTGTFTDASQTDFSSQLTASQTAGAELLFLPIYYTPISLIMNQAAQMNYQVSYFGVDGMDGLLDLEGFDKTLAEGAYLLTPFSADADDEKTQSFVAKYKAAHNEIPNQFAADGYDCVWATYNCLTAAGVTGDEDASELCEILKAAFAGGEFTYDGITGSSMTWTASGEVNKEPMAVIIKDGAYASVN